MQIFVIQKGDELPHGCELIDKSISGEHTADLNKGAVSSMLAIRRNVISPTSYIHGSPIVDDVCVVILSKHEDIPEGYVFIDKNVNKGSSGDKLYIAYRQLSPIGLCDLGYNASTLDRYPLEVKYSHLLYMTLHLNYSYDCVFRTLKTLPCLLRS